MNESSKSNRLPPLMSDEMAQLFVKGQLDILREELRRELEQEKIPLNQKELLKKFGFDVKYLRHLESLGLKKRKQGRDWMYDLADVYEIFELDKVHFTVYKPKK